MAAAAVVTLNEHGKKLLAEHGTELQPAALWKWFLWLTQIPRGSGNSERIRDELLRVGRELGLPTRSDAFNNVCITRAATPGYESAPVVVVQCHYDMVVAHEPAVRRTFAAAADGIVPELRNSDGWLYAHGTSLGADDGIGVATCLALLEGAAPQHPRIDALFTCDEETTMSGANGVAPALLSEGAKYLINVDSEDDRMLCLGSAGGESVSITFSPRREAAVAGADTDAVAALSVAVSGFRGGHTGVDINGYRANALKVLALLLARGCAGCRCRLDTFEGGQYSNAIPVAARAVVVLPRECVSKARDGILRAFEAVRTDYAGIEDSAALRVEVADVPLLLPCSRKSAESAKSSTVTISKWKSPSARRN